MYILVDIFISAQFDELIASVIKVVKTVITYLFNTIKHNETPSIKLIILLLPSIRQPEILFILPSITYLIILLLLLSIIQSQCIDIVHHAASYLIGTTLQLPSILQQVIILLMSFVTLPSLNRYYRKLQEVYNSNNRSGTKVGNNILLSMHLKIKEIY